MSEVITVDFPDIAGDVTAYTVFLRTKAGVLLNTGGDAIAEIATGIWTFILGEDRAANTHYLARIYSGTTETAANLVYTETLYPGQTLLGFNGDISNLTVIFGTVASGGNNTSFTASALTPAGSVANQFTGRILTFDNNTVTAGLRGQATDILTSSAAALPLFTFTVLTTAPADGDTFKIS